MLSKEKVTFSGTLKDMCDWLSIRPITKTNDKIKSAIEKLKENNIIDYIKEGHRYTIHITNKGLKTRKSIAVRKKWVETIKNYKEHINNKRLSVSWIKLLKIFIYCYDKGYIETTRKRLKEELKNNGFDISVDTIGTAVNILNDLDFETLKFDKNITKSEYVKNQIRTNTGIEISIGINFIDSL